MALKTLFLRKKIDEKNKALEALRAKDAEFATREAELEAAIGEVTEETPQEQKDALDESVNAFEAEKKEHDEAKSKLESDISNLEAELAAEEAAQSTEPGAPAPQEVPTNERKGVSTMEIRDRFFKGMSVQERTDFCNRDDVQGYLKEVRSAISEKRALTNVGLTIPEVMLGLLRQNIEGYSKLYKHVNVRSIRGTGRMLVMGAIPEAVWTECCAKLNELSIGFNDVTVDCYKVAGYFTVCNANLEDSDLNLAAELMNAIGQAIGLALDKAILYGKNGTATQKMPQGIVSRLVQTEKPSDYSPTARDWVDLHSTNIKSIATTKTGIALFQEIVKASAASKDKYARGERVWCMNETTRTNLITEAMTINAAGAIATGLGNQMPIIGGAIEILEFIPDNVIIGGYFELYLLVERRGEQFASSEHVKFLDDETVMKGTARYDGLPVIAEAFVAIGINGATPNATMTFASDTANA